MSKIEELKKELKYLEKEKHEVWEKYMGMAEKDVPYMEAWDWYSRQPVIRRYEQLEQEIRRLEEPVYEDIPKYGDHMTMKSFVDSCKCSCFCNSDGSGYYATKTKMTNIPVYPSDIMAGNYRRDFDYVVWFNK